MKPEDHDDLWQLLGRARTPAVSPFFARNVVREIRALKQEPHARRWTFLWRWQPLAASACLAALVTGGFLVKTQRERKEREQLLSMAERVYTSPDYTVIKDLDELIDSEKNSAWLSADLN